jgi:hypothetical protein
MLKLTGFIYVFILFFVASQQALAMLPPNSIIIGTAENVGMHEIDMVLPARIDTGAGMTSLHAEIIDIKPGINGEADKILFNISDHSGNEKLLEKDIERWIRIKKKGPSGAIRRPVVMMNYCLGGKQLEGQTNLANRSRFKYPLLIGRNVLKSGDYLVRTDKEFATTGDCKES